MTSMMDAGSESGMSDFPLSKRGIQGDLMLPANPPTPFAKGGLKSFYGAHGAPYILDAGSESGMTFILSFRTSARPSQ